MRLLLLRLRGNAHVLEKKEMKKRVLQALPNFRARPHWVLGPGADDTPWNARPEPTGHAAVLQDASVALVREEHYWDPGFKWMQSRRAAAAIEIPCTHENTTQTPYWSKTLMLSRNLVTSTQKALNARKHIRNLDHLAPGGEKHQQDRANTARDTTSCLRRQRLGCVG